MLYNKETKKVKIEKDCLSCKYYDKKDKRCTGLNVNCFEYDALSGIAIDGITKLPIKVEKE